ncbi:SDR family oxidoreductase [Musicola paradisiaca]|uniref:Short-chain dehydrogenase/reductase SDR n=1 Tax=Musicola paradisiaca (strain Ech703) TaxID=579405 RepID=C6C689_MUSP7|nr:SDR family oxidoreductase [Musicola paradisiaca]ACS87698.1 short-chain dehydrogenase/reductase SDR [Musicola paradisiaca Ech703]
MDLKGKRIMLTGASGGIGKALAMELAAREARLYLVGRNERELLSLLRRLPDPNHHNILLADLCDEQDRNALAECFPETARLDILINNAGTSAFNLFENHNHDNIRQLLALNTEAPILLTQSMLECMNNPGIIMNIGSTFGGIGYPGYSVYCATKFALRGFSEALNRELSSQGIKVLYLAPRATDTTLNSAAVNDMNKALGNKSDRPEWVAEQVVTALQQESTRRWLGWPEKLFVRINALLPALVDNIIRRQLSVIQRYARDQQK